MERVDQQNPPSPYSFVDEDNLTALAESVIHLLGHDADTVIWFTEHDYRDRMRCKPRERLQAVFYCLSICSAPRPRVGIADRIREIVQPPKRKPRSRTTGISDRLPPANESACALKVRRVRRIDSCQRR